MLSGRLLLKMLSRTVSAEDDPPVMMAPPWTEA
jgi:hypothetical protein